MTWTATEPAWAVPSGREIDDLHWLAYRARRDHGQPWHAGVSRTLAWVRGGRAAPITGRAAGPVTRAVAVVEMWAATAASTPDLTSPPLREISDRHGVVYLPPGEVRPELADGTWRTLRWLLGERGQAPPLPLPVRHADGTVPTADELYEIALATAPHRFGEPEQRAELRARVETNARRYRGLADVVAEARGAAGRRGLCASTRRGGV